MIDLYLRAINSDRCPDVVAALAVLAPVIVVLFILIGALCALGA